MSIYFIGVALAMWMTTIDEKKNRFALKSWQYWLCMLMAADGRWGKTANSMYYALGGQGGPA